MAEPSLQEIARRVDELEERVQSGSVTWHRRGFLVATGATIGGLLGTGAASAAHGTTAFHGLALLIGTEANRPAAGSSFFDDKPAYHYLYVATDTGARYVIETGDAAWSEQATHLVNYAQGELPTSPADGSLFFDTNRNLPAWWDGDAYEWPNFVDDVLLSAQTVADTTTRTVVWEPDIDAGSLVEGRIYQIDLSGVFSTSNTSDQFTVDVNIAGTDAAELQNAPANVTDAPWTLEITFTVRSHGVNGAIKPNTRATFNEQPRTASHAEIAVDTTVANNLAVAFQWSAADPDNSVTLEQAHLKQMG